MAIWSAIVHGRISYPVVEVVNTLILPALVLKLYVDTSAVHRCLVLKSNFP